MLADYVAQVLARSPNSFWEMQESGVPMADSGSSGIDLTTAAGGTETFQNAKGPQDILSIGIASGSDHLTGAGTCMTIPANGAFTVEAWVLADTQNFPGPASGYANLLTWAAGATLFWAGNTAAFTAHNKLGFIPSGFAGYGGTTMLDDTNYLVTYRRQASSGNIEVFINGVLDQTIAYGTGGFTFSTPSYGENFTGGFIGPTSLYDYDLADAEILAGYDAGIMGCSPPTNAGGTDSPSVSGTIGVGQTLTVDPGSWSGDATITFAYQWFRQCGTNAPELIVGETNVTYIQTLDDLGCDLFVEVTATNGCAPDGVADSDPVGPVTIPAPANTSPPTVSGVTAEGHQLTGDDGTWTDATSFSEQWYLDCGLGPVAISGETDPTIETTELMIGCTVLFGVVAHGPGGDSAVTFSAPFGPIEPSVAAARRFYQSPPWRFVVGDKNTFETLSFLDHIATDRSATFVLNGPAIAVGKVPSDEPEVNIPWPTSDDDPFLAEGNRVLWGFRREGVSGTDTDGPWVIRFAGVILQLEDTAESDNAFTHYTAYDPWQLLMARPVRNGPEHSYSLPGVDGSSYTATRIDVIIGELIRNTIHEDGNVCIDSGPDYGGTSDWGGTIEECDQIDINFQAGTTVGEAIQQMTQTDECDVILRPIYDPIARPGYLVELNIFNQAGAVQDDAIFAWDRPSRSLGGISRLKDGTQRATEVKFYAGMGGTGNNGRNIPVQSDADSIAKYGKYWAFQYWPAQNVADAVLALAQTQLQLRKDGKTTVAISPAPQRSPIPFQEYYLGDRVPVYASDRFREPIPPGGTEGIEYQRIYGIPVQIADDDTERIEQMLTSVQG